MDDAQILDVRAGFTGGPTGPLDTRLLLMLAERTDQAIAIFGPDLTPSYLNPALRKMLDCGEHGSLSAFRAQFRNIAAGDRQSLAKTLHRCGRWHGEILVLRDDRHDWALTLRGRVELLRDHTRKLGFAIVARQRAMAMATAAVAHNLTTRERDVLSSLLSGGTSKAIALRLGISHRTVEAHRAGIMRKFGVKSLSDLFRLTMPRDFAQPS